MTKFNRKIERKIKQKRKKQAKKDMSEKIALFDLIPEHCLVCEEPFDKTNKEMVQTWSVVVRKEQQKVNLYCPSCWTSALEKLKQIKEDINEQNRK